MISFEQFASFAADYSAVPVYRKILADLLTPVAAYMRLRQRSPHLALLESVEDGKYTRYSYIALSPRVVLSEIRGQVSLANDGNSKIINESIFKTIRDINSKYHVPIIHDLPQFAGGWVGFMGYETITWNEDVPIHDDPGTTVPDAMFILFEDMMIFDRLKNEIIICHHVLIDHSIDLREQYDAALRNVDSIGEALHTDIDYQAPEVSGNYPMDCNMTKEAFMSAVSKAREYIIAGDVFQLVLSQRFERQTDADPVNIYRALRNINPSPYMFLLDMNEFSLIGASPEVLVKIHAGNLHISPIAGTRRRGRSPEEDAELAAELLADEKERAEHIMLVDLARNDVGRVSEYGSVAVEDFMKVELYSHVMHIVSSVTGRVRAGIDNFDALMSGFPAGTLTGTPKIRAMELIHELENDRRGIYGGSVGHLDFHGNLDMCITIRTMLYQNKRVSFQSGAGIVFDSIPEREHAETLEKAAAIMRAIDFAEGGLQ